MGVQEDFDKFLKGDEQARGRILDYCLDHYRIEEPINHAAYIHGLFQTLLKPEYQNNLYALDFLGVFYLNGITVQVNNQQAVNLFYHAAQGGNSWGQASLGRCYLEGWGVAKDFDSAQRYFNLAINNPQNPCARAYALLGHMYKQGLGVPMDKSKAKSLFVEAIKRYSPTGYAYLCQGELDTNCNPFFAYQPKNYDFVYHIRKNTSTTVTIGGYAHGSTRQDIDSYTVTVEYTGPLNIGQRHILSRTIPNHYKNLYDYSMRKLRCCSSQSEYRELELLNEARALILRKEAVKDIIAQADTLISERIAAIQDGPAVIAPVIVNTGNTVTMTQEQFNLLIQHVQKGNSVFQAAPAETPNPERAEKQPLLQENKSYGTQI